MLSHSQSNLTFTQIALTFTHNALTFTKKNKKTLTSTKNALTFGPQMLSHSRTTLTFTQNALAFTKFNYRMFSHSQRNSRSPINLKHTNLLSLFPLRHHSHTRKSFTFCAQNLCRRENIPSLNATSLL